MIIKSFELEKSSQINLFLPVEYFELEDEEDVFIFNRKKYYRIELKTEDKESLPTLSFKNNQVKYDSEWYSDFVVEIW